MTPDAHARSPATLDANSFARTLLVAALLTLAPLAGLVAVTAAGPTLAFLAGAATAVVVAFGRRRTASRSTPTGPSVPVRRPTE